MSCLAQNAQIFKYLRDGVIVTDANGIIADWNVGAERLFGYSKQEIIGQTPAILHQPDDAPVLASLLVDVDESGVWLGEITIVRKDGEKRFCETTLAPLFNDDAEQVGTVSISHDITTRRLAEQRVVCDNAHSTRELQASNARLAAALEELKHSKQKSAEQARLGAIGEIASGVSHNLNNLLSPSIILLDLLLAQDGLSDQTLELVSAIKTSTHDAAELVSRLGLLYRKTDVEARSEPVDLCALMEEIPALTAGKWRNEPRETGREVSLELQLEKVPPINANATDLRQCLVNLVFNAVDAIKRSGVIYLRLKNKGDSIVITVQDNGRGMTAIEQQQCLEPFFTTKAAGTGLGLPLCVGIVENHRGTFSLSSTPCEGTSIHIELPVNPIAPTPPVIETERLPATYRILYIDDEPMVRKSMSLLLEALGHHTDVAENGFVGIEKFKEHEYDIVISDFSMPGLNGRRVASAIKALSPTTIVILVTGWPIAHIAPRALEDALEDTIIGKPLTIDKLRNVLHTTRLKAQ